MTGRPDRERIREAKRVGLRARMVGEWRVPPDTAAELLDAWEAVAAARGLPEDDPTYPSEREGWLRERSSAF